MPKLVPPLVEQGVMAAMGQPTIAGDPGVVLRPFELGDTAWVVAAFDDPLIQRWNLRRMDDTPEAVAWIGHSSRAWAEESEGNWLIARAGTGERLGQLGLRGVDLAAGCAEVSYWLVPSARGCGVAHTAVSTAARWLFDELGMRRLEIVHSVANDRSCRVARRAGFALEGTLRSCQLHADGWHDMHLHARISTDR